MPEQTHLFDDMERGASLSSCERYRFRLYRRWSQAPIVTFIMLNPSTADALADDPTIRRCIGFAKAWGAGGIEVVNLFTLRATDPFQLTLAADPIGPNANDHLAAAARSGRLLVCAWGTSNTASLRTAIQARAAEVLGILKKRELHCLGTTKDGSPRHPLYLAATTKLVRFQKAA